MAHWTLAQAQSLAPPCRALSSALLSQTPWQISLGESKASLPQRRVLHSFFTKDVSSPRILILFTSSHVYRVPTAPWHVPRCLSLHYRSVSSRPPSPFYLERTLRPLPQKALKGPLPGTLPRLLKPLSLRDAPISTAQKVLSAPPWTPSPLRRYIPCPGTPPHLTMP